MTSLRLVGACLVGFLLVGACATRQSPLAQSDDSPGGSGGADAGAAGSAGSTSGGAAGQEGEAGSGGAGQGGSAVAGQGGGGEGGAAGTTGGTAGQGGGPIVVKEPDGPPEFRLMNGVTDFPSVRVCWLPWDGGAPSGVDATPSPEVLYGDTSPPLFPESFDPSKQSFRLHVLAGDLTALDGKGCLSLVSEPPAGVRVVPLPVLPPGATTAPRSRLAVAVGCLGGGAVPDVTSACGQGADPAQGNANLLLVELSRIPPPAGQFGLQVVHSSTALPVLNVQLTSSGIGVVKSLASSLSLGKIAPRPPFTGVVGDLFGVNIEGARLVVNDATNGVALVDTDVGALLSESGLSSEKIIPDHGGVLVILGPRPGSPVDAAPVTPTRVRWLEAPSL